MPNQSFCLYSYDGDTLYFDVAFSTKIDGHYYHIASKRGAGDDAQEIFEEIHIGHGEFDYVPVKDENIKRAVMELYENAR